MKLINIEVILQKEKAKELVGKYMPYVDWNGFNEKRALINAKQCALLAVDEIIDILEINGFTLQEYHDKGTLEYWIHVKDEIEKL
jgi:hypothetical protein